MKSIEEKFESLGVINDLVSGKVSNPFILEIDLDNINHKRYAINVFIENKEEVDNHLNRINEISSKGDHLKELIEFINNNEVQNTKKIYYGTIDAHLVNNNIEIIISKSNETISHFIFKPNDYLDGYLNYLENDLRTIIRKEVFELNF